jgi:hypothetical protein
MNPKFLFLAVLLVSIHFTIPGLVTNANSSEKAMTSTNETTSFPTLMHIEHHDFLLFIDDVRDFYENLAHPADDSKFYLFHFERVRRSRLATKLWLALARMVIILSHLSVLVYAFKGLLTS